ncbi:MAG: hypothetical protein A3E82_00390 [Gammaproteobacteria bacterium RIFCSPHIGHO2_12_FULL_38_11]|nr:MAG: hypothetical protein A3E82_00390 [Gammaproteobacteria bacterium RIFCSPHIGHO2_12_FULL_38_11]
MREIGSFDAKTHLSQLLDRVNLGESFAITKYGRVVALLTPAANKPHLAIHEVISGILSLRKKIVKRGIKMSSAEVCELKNKGRR